jgi:hypothetical protein
LRAADQTEADQHEAGQHGLPLRADRPAPPTAADYARLAGLGGVGEGVFRRFPVRYARDRNRSSSRVQAGQTQAGGKGRSGGRVTWAGLPAGGMAGGG